MEVTYALSINDVVEFDRFLIRRSLAIKVRLAIVILLAPLAFGAFWLSQTQTWSSDLIGAAIAVALGVLWALLIFGSRTSSIRRRNAKAAGRKTARLYSDGIFVAAELVETKYRWIGVTEITDNSNYIFLFLSPLTAIIIPKAAFGSQKQSSAFLGNARACWTNTRQGTHLPLVDNDAETWPPPPQTLRPG